MTKHAFWLGTLMLSLALPGAGCDGVKSCETLCEQVNECAEIPAIDSCEVYCKDRSTLLEQSACQTQQQEYDDCVSNLPDACDASTICTTTALALKACIDDYCEANVGATGCP